MKKNRRDFIKMTGIAGLSFGISGLSTSYPDISENNDIKIISPVDGDMLHEYDGIVSNGKLNIKVQIKAPYGSSITVNDMQAKYLDGIFQADVGLNHYENVIDLADRRKNYRRSIKVFWLKNYTNKYRFSFDDNIWFLKDINDNADRYNSIFENPYMGVLKKMHDTYGTKVHLNLYYKTEGFNLSQMTNKFKNEWRANSDWIGLSFHAKADQPARPYINAGYDQVKKDCALVDEQIKRFAGEELMGPETTLHWGEATVEGCRALRDSGYTVLAGYFNVDDNQAPVSYYLSEEQRRHLKHRFIWRDNNEGIIFSRIAIVVNSYELDQIRPHLDNVWKTYNPRYIDLMIHEQYFYSHFSLYQPDFQEKIMTAAKWAFENGYEPGFLKESVLK